MAAKEITPHSKVVENEKRWEFLERSYKGGDDYRKGGYLIQHDLEHESAFNRRCEQAMFVNFCAPPIDIYTSYLFREQPDRDLKSLKSPALDAFLKDADLMGHSYEQVIRDVSRKAGIYGYHGILVDKPESIEADTRLEEHDAGIRPYMVTYEPENIYNWRFDVRSGRKVLVWLLLEEESDEKNVRFFREWTETTWELWGVKKNEAPKSIGKGNHKLNKIPFIFAPNNLSKVSDIRDIADINKRIYYFDSDALEIIERTAFPFLEEPRQPKTMGNKVGEGDKVVGTGNVLSRDPEDSVGHRWVEAPHTSLQRILDWRNQAVQDIMMLAKTGQVDITKSGAESGVALELRFQQLNALLTEKAEAMENTERQIFALFALWENKPEEEVEIEYPRKFGVRDLAHDIDLAIQAKSAVPSRTFAQAAGMGIAGRYLRDMDEPTRKKIEAELLPVTLPTEKEINDRQG